MVPATIITITAAAIACIPVVLLWALGVLLGTAIPLTLKTWFAALLVLLFFGSSKK